MHKNLVTYLLFTLLLGCTCTRVFAQDDDIPDRYNTPLQSTNNGRFIPKDTTKDKLQHRDAFEDSITISYRFFDSSRLHKLDSSISDFYTRYPVPYYYTDLGNFGNGARSLFFDPLMKAGFDAGFHAYDIYRYDVKGTKFFTTTRPYTEITYLIGGRAEQMAQVMHTQNRNSNLNFTFEYRLINSPGSFKSTNTSHSNLRINIGYSSSNKRYGNNLIVISNKIRSSLNGGIVDAAELTGLSFNDPFAVATKLGNNSSFSRNFSSNIRTGNIYDERVFLFRQYYDLGQRDSLVTDSVTYKLFYPRFRIQHTLEYHKEDYIFQDLFPEDSIYRQTYNLIIIGDTVRFQDRWQNITNDVSLISYPQKDNQNQFLKLSAGYELIYGGYYPYITKYNNIYAGGEYRNRTRNQKWDIVAAARLYVSGEYSGNYNAFISLERELGNNAGSLQIGFNNVNRSPSAIFSRQISSFPVFTGIGFKNENISKIFASVQFSKLKLLLQGNYYIVANYTYFNNYFNAVQQSAVFNVLHVSAEKKVPVSKNLNWYIEAHVQQTTGQAPVNLPLIFTRNRFAFEGNFFKNLFLSTGIEIKYNTPYKAAGFSPLNSQFIFQDTVSISNRPDINLFFNFRIKSFKAFVRLENINAINPADKYRFTRYNFSAPYYPQRALWFRMGIWWNFVN